jgi:hypothetical protein
MGRRDKRIDAYIARSAEFAQPILTRLRELVHATCPEVEETLKWSHPSFEYKGMLCGMAAFKAHAVFGFWKHEQVVGTDPKAKEAMGSFGCLKSVADLPGKKAFAGFMKEAMRLNDEGVKAVRRKTGPRPKSRLHPELRAALARNARAQATFDGFPPSAQREYMEWVAEAKGEDTRARRVKQSVEWMAQGKRRNWKYARC